MPTGSSGSTQALVAPMHRGGGEPETQPHRLLLQRMAPLFRPAPTDRDRRLTRLLVNVTVDRSLWPVHLVLGADATVADLVRAAVAAYVREGRRPPLQTGTAADAADGFELHLHKYSLESLRPEEMVLDLGSRNFFLCARRSAAAA
ncbi:uncharacterized protein At4g22758-like [Miscanthus floridulus]|uniref:uncharacterized protein At4g22758-like n=1 Tax=Miscanthus floridulus TaxID=154761 RepID=UPI00345AC56D